MTPQTTPRRLNLKKEQQLEIEWQDGKTSVYGIAYLRSMCPCAQCKQLRQEQEQSKSLLRVLPGNYAAAISATDAELVGNYAMRIDFSDHHASGIYSFQYLREIAPPPSASG